MRTITIYPEEIRDIKKLTNVNHHTMALIRVAEIFDLHETREILKHIYKIHDLEGFMPKSLHDYRYVKGEEILNYIKENYGEEVFNQIRSCL